MQNMNNRTGILAVMFAVMVLGCIASGDVYVESEQTSQGVVVQADGTRTVKSYYASNYIRTEFSDLIMIMDLDGRIMYQLNPIEKTYLPIRLDMIQMPGVSEEQARQMQVVMQRMMADVTTTPTDDVQTISGYACQKFLMTIMASTHEFWISKDVEEFEEFAALIAKMRTLAEQNPMLTQNNLVGIMTQFDGFPVRTVMTVLDGTVTTTVTHIEKTSFDREIFMLPEDYTPVEQ